MQSNLAGSLFSVSFLFHRKLCSYEIKTLRVDRTAAEMKMAPERLRRRRRILRSRIPFYT